MRARKVLYYALWPVQEAAFFLGWVLKWARMLIIVTNPLFLTIYLMNRRRSPKTEEDKP